MKKELIFSLKCGTVVFARLTKGSVEYISQDTNSIVCNLNNKSVVLSFDEVFVSSPSIEIISTLVLESWEFLKESFNVSLLNSEIQCQFIRHWKNMCESEYDSYSYDIMFNDFIAFQKELLKAVEVAKDLRVSNIPLLKEV